jgi:hypothetical protein
MLLRSVKCYVCRFGHGGQLYHLFISLPDYGKRSYACACEIGEHGGYPDTIRSACLFIDAAKCTEDGFHKFHQEISLMSIFQGIISFSPDSSELDLLLAQIKAT